MLLNSIRTFNIDNIPIYTCVNDGDYDLFVNNFSDYKVTFIKDSDVYDTSNVQNVWYKQQLIKMNFWRLNIARHMIQIDSDSFFIKNFKVSDFMVDDDTPYTILHENKELKEFFARYNLFQSKQDANGDFWIAQGFAGNSSSIRKIFGTEHITAEYDYGHPPCVWSNKVWELLYTNYIEPNKLTYEQLLSYANSEQQWYGETLLALQPFPIFPKENMFKTFHYEANYSELKKTDSLSNVIYNYYGICLQSNWCNPANPMFNEIYSHFFTPAGFPKIYNGQFLEDKWISENVELPLNGVVVDVGADEPIYGSNTYFFEKALGWDAICIDADSRVIDKLKRFRKKVVHSIVTDYDGVGKFLQTEAAGISHVSDNGVEVPANTLNSILEENNIHQITVLDIDVEGHELQVCRGLNWEKYKPYVVIIEFGSPAGGYIEPQIMEYFSNLKVYKLIHKTQANLIFIRNETL
jgi:FkbM family methyltransferase